MNCKKCGNTMADGSRFCIKCGAEHDSNGNLVSNGSQSVDYNKTVMTNNFASNNGGKIDYNKTMMANDVPMNNGSGGKIDYNKTMMANDIPMNGGSGGKIDYNKTMMANDVPQYNSVNNNYNQNTGAEYLSNNKVKQKKKVSPVLIIIVVVLGIVAIASIILPKKRTKKIETSKEVVTNENFSEINESSVMNVEETTISGNVVTDFNPDSGYWSLDNEFFYRNNEIVKNEWIGDCYVGDDGRKVRNKLIDDTYYVDANGQKVKNQWYKYERKIGLGEVTVWYYLGPDGAKLKDTYSPDGYYLDRDGIYIQEDN